MRVFLVKDLIRRWRSPVATLVMIIFPLFMTGMLGLVFGHGGDNDEFPPIKVLIEDRDGGFITEVIKGALGGEEAQKRLRVEFVVDVGRSRMERGMASALVFFPAGFTDAVLSGRPAQIEIVRNPAEGISPEIVEQGVQVLAVYLDQLQRVLGQELRELQAMIEDQRVPLPARVGVLASAMTERMRSVERYLFPPLVTVESVKQKEERGDSFSLHGYLLIMTTVMALLFVAARILGDMFDEQKSGMLKRQLASPAPVSRIIGAKLIFGVGFGLLIFCILAVIGLATGWIELPVDPGGSLLLALAFSLAASGVVALVLAFVRTEKQAGIASWLVVMAMSALGGSMINVEAMPAPMQKLAPFTLNYWVIGGFKELVFAGKGIGGVARHSAILGGVGAATLITSYLLLVRRYREVRS